MDDDLDQTNARIGQAPKHLVAKINNAPFADEAMMGASVGDGDPGGARWLRVKHAWVGLENDADASAQGIKPGSSGELVGIKALSVGHAPTAVIFAVP